MNRNFHQLYVSILKELWGEFQSAEALYLEISRAIFENLNTDNVRYGLLKQSEMKYQKKISGIIANLRLIYPGRIEMFPIPDNAGLLQRMEIRNRQAEELERVLRNLFEQKKIKLPKNKMNHQWNVLTEDMEDMEDMENTSNMDNQSTENNKSCEKTNIVVIGQSSVGKRSLIQAVTRRGTVPYRLLKDIYCGGGNTVTIGIDVYETEIANFIVADNVIRSGQRMEEYAGDILNTVGAYLKLSSAGTAACNIWFCIDGSCENISNEDAALIKNCSREVLLVVTKCELMRKEQTESTMNELLALIDRDRIVMVSAENKTGLPQLIKKAQTMAGKAVTGDALNTLQERWDAYYADMRESWNENVSDEADGYINWAAGRAATIALLPLPMADVAPLMLNEVYMIYKLAGVYGVAVDNTVITMLLGCAGGSILGKVGASLLPFLKVPIAAGITYGVGKAAKAYFESDMTMNISQLKEIFLNGEREAKGREWGM